MLPISRILVPVDFSDRCLALLPYVKFIAQQYGSEVTLLHVLNPYITIPPTALSGPAMIPVPQSSMEETSKRLEEFAVRELEGLNVRRLLYEGDPVAQIVQLAQAEKADLIAMPTHGHGALREFLIGSVTSKVLHDVKCPVLTGVHRKDWPSRKPAKFSKVFCALDLKTQSKKVLDYALRLAGDFNAKLALVHAITQVDPEVAVLMSPDFKLKLDEIARNKLQKLQSATGSEEVSSYVEEGETAEVVCAVAGKQGADLLVIGRGPQDGSAGRLTTNSYAIIRQSPCPVISV